MGLGFLNSSYYIISGELDEIPPDRDEVSGEIYLEKKRNYPDVEISEYGGEDTEVAADRESGVCSQPR